MDEPPQTPSDERDGEPYYIPNKCAKCGAELELADPDSGWNDEWSCTNGCTGIHLDVPGSPLIEETK